MDDRWLKHTVQLVDLDREFARLVARVLRSGATDARLLKRISVEEYDELMNRFYWPLKDALDEADAS